MDFVVMTLVRLVVPLTILRWPLLGGILSILADMSDWNILTLRTEHDYAYYQSWDKILDMYYLSLEAFVILSWKSIWAKRISLFFYFYRFLGVIFFEIIHIRSLLFYFPNIFEALYFFYLFFFSLKSRINLPQFRTSTLICLTLLIPSKLSIEYVLHVAPTKLMIQLQQFFLSELMRVLSHTILVGLTITGSSIYLFNKRKEIYSILTSSTVEVDTTA